MKTVLLYGFDLKTYEKYIQVLRRIDVSYICLKNTNYSLKRALEREDRFYEMAGEEMTMIFFDFNTREINKILKALKTNGLVFNGLLVETYQGDLSTKLKVLIKDAKIGKEVLYKRSMIKELLEKVESVYICEDDERISRYQDVIKQGYFIIKNNSKDLERINSVLASLNDMLKENML